MQQVVQSLQSWVLLGNFFLNPSQFVKLSLGIAWYMPKHLPSDLLNTYSLWWFHSPPHFVYS